MSARRRAATHAERGNPLTSGTPGRRLSRGSGAGAARAAGSPLDPALTLLVYLRASYINGCAYCVDSHTRDALAAGESDRRLYATAAWRESPLFSDRERAAFALTDAITQIPDHDVDAAYEAAAEHFHTDELAALIYAIVTINGWNRLAISTHMVFEG